jgi:hypothetical protein
MKVTHVNQVAVCAMQFDHFEAGADSAIGRDGKLFDKLHDLRATKEREKMRGLGRRNSPNNAHKKNSSSLTTTENMLHASSVASSRGGASRRENASGDGATGVHPKATLRHKKR